MTINRWCVIFEGKAVSGFVVVIYAAIFLASISEAIAENRAPAAFPGQTSDWNGFTRYDFEVDQKPVLVVAPKKAAAGNPWVWHGEFFGHKPAPDIELLRQGFHIVYLRVPNMLGGPQAVDHWNHCYETMTTQYHLAKKVALVGLSRGGLYCYNWATANPDRVACIYGDAPVCDFKSWPGGRGTGKGSPKDWKLVMQQYRFDNEADALAYPNNPVDNLAALAKAGIPLLHVYGDDDDVVPWEENTGLLATRYRELGGSITLIAKPGIGHHPHGLVNSKPIVDFILKHASTNSSSAPARKRPHHVDQLAAELEPSVQMVYKQVDSGELYLHVFKPSDWSKNDRRPCFVVIHGGGWVGGEPRRMFPFAKHFADLGMVGISLQYRLLNAKQGTSVFDCVKDGRSAVRFIKSHATDLGIDAEKIIVSGASAGGHVAAGTALFSAINEQGESAAVAPVPAALVLLFPVIDTSEKGYGNQKIGERWRELSPAHQVTGPVPPTLVFHGTSDTVTPLAGAKAFQEAMTQRGNRCRLDIHEGGKHGYLMFEQPLYEQTLAKTETFLNHLGLLSSD